MQVRVWATFLVEVSLDMFSDPVVNEYPLTILQQIPIAVTGGAMMIGKGIGKGISTGDGRAVVSGFAEGATSVGTGVGQGVETVVVGAAEGVLSVGQGLFSGAKSIGKGISGAFRGKPSQRPTPR